jgi:hypothetical protein
MDFGGSFTGMNSMGKLFHEVSGTDAFELYESMYSSFTVLKNVYKSQEKAAGTMTQAIGLTRETPLRIQDILSVFSTFSVNPQLRDMLSNKEQMGQLAKNVAGLGFLVPEQGSRGAAFAMREAFAGNFRSMRMRFALQPEMVAAAGGMSVAQMKQRPQYFQSALSAFLNTNLGQSTFNDLQMTFSKQVNHIYDAISGGIWKGFQGTGMYQSVTMMTYEASNMANRFFKSGGFDTFFKGFGQAVTSQFSQATSIFRTIDFEKDPPEATKQKLTKAISAVTKDLVVAVTPQIETLSETIAPVAKSVGAMVSSSISKTLASVLGGSLGIGVNSIVTTLEMPFTSLAKSLAPQSWQGGINRGLAGQADFITEHPFVTLGAGIVGSRPIVDMITRGTQNYGGMGNWMSSW